MASDRDGLQHEAAVSGKQRETTLAEVERINTGAFLLRSAARAPIPFVPDRFGLIFPLAASCLAILFAGVAFAIAMLS